VTKQTHKASEPLTVGQLRKIVRKHLPGWVRACAAEADAIVLHEAAFGTSDGELFLFACAIKYAANAGKTVHVSCGEGTGPNDFKVSESRVEATYRDRKSSKGRSAVSKR